MKICILSAVILALLTNDASADEQANQNNLITTYDPGEASLESPNFPRLLSNGVITADDRFDNHPKNQGHVRFEDQYPHRPIKFEDDQKDYHGDVSLNDEEAFDKNDRVSNTAYERESINSENKIKFEDNNVDQENSEHQEGNDEVFDDNDNADENESEFLGQSEIEAETTSKPIKFENQDNESIYNHSERNTVTERVVFKDDSNINAQPVQKKKRKPQRKPRFKANQTNFPPAATNSPNPGLGYPGYQGVGYPGPGYPGPGDPNSEYPGYPTPGYPSPGYPYPNYPSPYPGMAFATSVYPGYSPYPSIYSPMYPGYGAYPTQEHQIPGNQKPPKNSAAYPNPGQGDPNGHPDTRYPSQDYTGSPSPVAPPPTAPQSGQPGPAYPGPENPYYQGYAVPGYPPPYPADPNSQYPPQNQAPYRPHVYPGPHQPGYANGPQRPSRKPKSLTQRAVSAVAEALTSIALYDDKQCVPRILCEMAGGSTASSPTLLKASASLQPLLTLLQSYNGVSTSPLFIFGHAAVTGVTAKGNPSACYRAYPQCPTDPEKLINYLNNHNGGFFRFFGLPETPKQPHNLEQFYNYLSGQTGLPQQPQQQNYGYPMPYRYGFPPQNPFAQPYNYGHNYHNEHIGYRNTKNDDSEVEGRIQNKPGVNVIEAESDSVPNESQDKGSNWSFPEEGGYKGGSERDKVKRTKQPKRHREQYRPSRGSKTLKFPDERSDDRRDIQMIRDYPRKEKRIFFPGQNNFQINTNYQTTTPVNPEEYYFDYKHNFYVKRPKALKTDDVVYVVRGNGDPNHPEIVRVRPGQSI